MTRPGLHAGMHLRAEQQMLLQPRMLQSIEVLQLPSLALESWLLEQAESNEALNELYEALDGLSASDLG